MFPKLFIADVGRFVVRYPLMRVQRVYKVDESTLPAPAELGPGVVVAGVDPLFRPGAEPGRIEASLAAGEALLVLLLVLLLVRPNRAPTAGH